MTRLLLLLAAALLPAPAQTFSHLRHANVNLACTFCHKTAETAEHAGFPAWKTCHTCHTQMPEQAIPSRRVYKLPDFVFFSHARHIAAKTECATCHGDVKTQDRIEIHRSTRMAACVDCHKERQAATACNVCHELGQ